MQPAGRAVLSGVGKVTVPLTDDAPDVGRLVALVTAEGTEVGVLLNGGTETLADELVGRATLVLDSGVVERPPQEGSWTWN